jgi:GntR family transcriptional regulator
MSDLSSRLTASPLYIQVRDLVLEKILSGYWQPGSPIPNEHELSQELGVSIGTIRKALDIVENEGLLTRKQGRGTFVRDFEERPMSFSNVVARNGDRIIPTIQSGSSEIIEADAALAKLLGAAIGGPVLRIKRTCVHLGKPFKWECCYLPAQLFPKLPDDLLNYRISSLAQRNSIAIGKRIERVDPATATDEDAERLKIEPGKQLLALDRIIYSMDKRVIERRVARCNMAHTKYEVRAD